MAVQIPPGTQCVYVSFSAEINPNTTEALIAVMAECASSGAQEVYLLLSTPGGSVMNGLNLYNVLKAMPFKLTTHNVGNVDSIGNIIFLAGKQRYTCAHATFMFHGVGFNAAQGQRFEEKDLRERLDSVLSDQKRLAAVIAGGTKLNQDTLEGMFREAQTRDAQFAVDSGIVHEIRDVEIPSGTPVISLVFQR